jgi:hypothetical protein
LHGIVHLPDAKGNHVGFPITGLAHPDGTYGFAGEAPGFVNWDMGSLLNKPVVLNVPLVFPDGTHEVHLPNNYNTKTHEIVQPVSTYSVKALEDDTPLKKGYVKLTRTQLLRPKVF